MKSKWYLIPVLVAVMCLAGWTTHAKLQTNNSARQNWEYLDVPLDPSIEATRGLNQLGADG
jgi:hypothetical protein